MSLLRRKVKISLLTFLLVVLIIGLFNIQISFNILHTKLSQSQLKFTKDKCPRFSLHNFDDFNVSYGVCEPHLPTNQDCDFAKKLYFLDGKLTRCTGVPHEKQICKIERQSQSNFSDIGFVCNRELCYESSDRKNFQVYTLNPKDGELKLKKEFRTFYEMEQGLPNVLHETIKNKFYFLFLRCKSRHGLKKQQITQLMPIDPWITLQRGKNRSSQDFVNVNILLLDSVSRAHFYRSLPNTIKTFRHWANNSSYSPASVFDFELFQAVHGHTKEVTRALFKGSLGPPKSGASSVGMEVLFGAFKNEGYQTMWQEDLCFKAIWGLPLDVGAGNWEALQAKLRHTFIDHTGITHSSCEVLSSYGLKTPFNGPKGDQICYNGRFQHSYFLQSVVDMVNAISSSSEARPLLSYMSLSVGHDDRGRRIQSLDIDLEEYVTNIAQNNNTLTIMLADHGNTYTRYTNAVVEGRFEMFHPHLFVIVPNKVARMLGADVMAALRVNQRRLVSAFDLHSSLMAIAKPVLGKVKPAGIFAPIPRKKTCDDIELATPNLCVCDGWDSPTEKDPMQLGLAEFAIGELNNQIQDQFFKRLTEGSTLKTQLPQACKRLKPLSFNNPRQRNSKSDGSLITSFDIEVEAGDVVPQKRDSFHVEVQTFEFADVDSFEMKVLSFERTSMFGKYSRCADHGVSLKLCVCSENKTFSHNAVLSKSFAWKDYLKYFGEAPTLHLALGSKYVFLAKREHEKGKAFAFELVNTCGVGFTVQVYGKKIHNAGLSRSLPFETKVYPFSVRFVLSALRKVSYWNSVVDVYSKIIRSFDRHP